jgi:hypothetical protein
VDDEERREGDEVIADVNAHVYRLAERLERSGSDGKEWSFMCECGDASCHERVHLSVAEYEELKRQGRPVLAAGHDPEPPAD